mmetsp:Transcript_17259/g.44387  ORF Transcript_17259/g.44387 Transcript_17259/m.44387 type:complete len:290 (-) Transcript_17259:537-1406(-)
MAIPRNHRAADVARCHDPEGQPGEEVRHRGGLGPDDRGRAQDEHHRLEKVGAGARDVADVLADLFHELDRVQEGDDVLHLLLHHAQLVHHVLLLFGKALLNAVPALVLQLHDALLQLKDATLLLHLVVIHLTHELAADLRALGEDAPTDAKVEGDNRGPRSEARQACRVQDPDPHPRHAAQRQRRRQQAADGAGAHADLQRLVQRRAHGVGEAAGALHRHADTDARAHEVEEGAREEARERPPASRDEDIPPAEEQEDADHRDGPLQIDPYGGGDEHADVHDFLVPLVL